MSATEAPVGIERVAGDIQRRDAKAPALDRGEPLPASRGVTEKPRHVAVWRRGETADTDLDIGHGGHRLREQVEHDLERAIEECLQ